jgi:hypothetical protein
LRVFTQPTLNPDSKDWTDLIAPEERVGVRMLASRLVKLRIWVFLFSQAAALPKDCV